MSKEAEKIGLPPREFMYTLDQVATMLQVSENTFAKSYVYYYTVSTGPPRRDLIMALNVAPRGERDEWRITEKALIKWMRHKGIRFYTQGFA